MDVVSEQIVTNLEAKKLIEERVKNDEPKYEQKNALSILRKFAKGKVDDVKQMVDELKTISKLRDKKIIEIVNVLPEDKEDLRTIFQKEFSLLTQEELDKILDIVKKYS
ncbi:MAG TPA: RNA polymerase Rpb4 family protein [archaeon]|nr:RNA polymerase Rpb4 family protein [archaeon]